MKQKKKTQRRYTPVRNSKHYMQVLASHKESIAFRYYTDATCRKINDVTYSAFAETIRRQAAAFAEIGLAGKRIAIIGETSCAWISTYLAAVAGGSVAIPMDKELSFDEILGFLAISEADAVVYSKAFNEKFASVENHETLRYFIPISPSGNKLEKEEVFPYERLIAIGEKHPEYQFPETEDTEHMAEMLFTSGTTGTSKCVMLSEKNIIASSNAACECVEFFPEDTVVSVLPIHHTYELCCMLAELNYGMTIGINDSLKHVIKSFTNYRPTGLVLVPLFVETMYKRIWDEAKKKKKVGTLRFTLKLSAFLRRFGIDVRRKLFARVLSGFGGRLERIVCGGAPLSPETVARFDDFGILVMEGYGITECSPLVSVNPYFALKRGSVGPTVQSCEARIDGICINDKGLPEGEIIVRGENVMLGYLNEKDNEDAFTENGWYRTGDVGFMDRDGYLYITGRVKSVIVLENGKNVFPEEIEEYISHLPGVSESVVVGRKNEEGETVLTAVIVPDPVFFDGKTAAETETTLKESIRLMNKKLATFKHVKAIQVRLEPFEKTTSRKIKRHLVK